VNWARNVEAKPQQIFRPTSVDELVAIVKQAEANNPPLQVHAVGSGWSFTDVMTATGYMVETDNLNGVPSPTINLPPGQPPIDYGSTQYNQLQRTPKRVSTLSETMSKTTYPNDPVFGSLTDAALARNLYHVEAGIKIADLYTVLERSIPASNPAITTSDGLWHGYAVQTLGGSGGQAIVGAITTSVHGGDDHDPHGNPIQPLPDMVHGIRLVGAGGVEYFIQRGGSRAIVDPVRLAQLDPCLTGPGQIITDDDTFNAVVVSMGRMGIIYSVVLEVRPQYFLQENPAQRFRWKSLSSSVAGKTASGRTIGDFRADSNNRFLNIVVVPYVDWEQSAIGGNTTASTPFVVPDPSGPRSLLSLAKQLQTNTASGIAKKLGRKWPPPPTISVHSFFDRNGAWVYFRGTDIDPAHFRTSPGTLWKIRDDGSRMSQIGSNTTGSQPFVVKDSNGLAWVYFQGIDNALWKIRDDGTQQYHIGENTPAGKQYTNSTPFVVPDPAGGAWIYYQGTDNTLWKIRDDGSQHSQIGGNTTSSAPFVVKDSNGVAWVYFRGTDNALWKVRDDGNAGTQYHIGENTPAGKQYTTSSPFVVPDPAGGAWVYYLGSNNPVAAIGLCKIRDDGSLQSQIGGNNTASTPFVVPDPKGGAWVYFQGTDNTLWKVRDDGSLQAQIGGNTTAAQPFVVPDPKGGAWVYFRGTDIGLNNPWGPGTLWKVRDDSDHACFVTTRSEIGPTAPQIPPTTLGDMITNYVCQLPPGGLRVWTMAVIAALEAFTAGTAVLLSLIPFVGPILAGIDIAAAGVIIGLLQGLVNNPNATVGDYLATAVNVLTKTGQFGLAANLVNQVIAGNRSSGQSRTDVSFRIMDTVDYKGPNCYKALALEVGFNADDVAYINYLTSVFNWIIKFQSQNILYGGYISLRYCGGSEALLAIEQWPHTVCIEFGALAHLDNEKTVLQQFEDETANHVGADGRLPTVHWGQLNSRTPQQIAAIFPGKIDRWRSALTLLSAKGNSSTFDNDFCKNHGLEVPLA
jgi:hypothetical protein